MANEVTLTAALRSNLLSLQGTQRLLDQTQLRLATGKKVNSALDNPSSYFASESLTNRAGDLSNLLDAMGQAVQVLKATDQGIQSLTTYVQQAQAIAQSAQNSLSSSAFIRSGDIDVTHVANLTLANSGGYAVNSVIGLEIGNSGTVNNVTITSGMSLAQLASAMNAVTGISAQIVDSSSGAAAGARRLEIRATNGQQLEVTGLVAVMDEFRSADATGGVIGSLGDGTTWAANSAALTIAATSNTPDQIALEKQFNTVITQINSLITDTGYKGTNLLNGDTMNVQFNENNTSKLSVVGVTFNAAGLGLSYTAGTTFLNAANITSTLNSISGALTTLRAQAQTFGNNLTVIQTRSDFTTELIDTLKAGSDALTLADKNEEGANLLALQTAQQLGIQALSLASQANQSVLRLFQ